MKTVCMEARDPHDHSACNAKTEVRLIQLRSTSAERDSTLHASASRDSQLDQLALYDLLEAGRGSGKYFQRGFLTDYRLISRN